MPIYGVDADFFVSLGDGGPAPEWVAFQTEVDELLEDFRRQVCGLPPIRQRATCGPVNVDADGREVPQ